MAAVEVDQIEVYKDVIVMEEGAEVWALITRWKNGATLPAAQQEKCFNVLKKYGLISPLEDLKHSPLDSAWHRSFWYYCEHRQGPHADPAALDRLVISVALSSAASRSVACRRMFEHYQAQELDNNRGSDRGWKVVPQREFERKLGPVLSAMGVATQEAFGAKSSVEVAHMVRAVALLVKAEPGDPARRASTSSDPSRRRLAVECPHPFCSALKKLTEAVVQSALKKAGVLKDPSEVLPAGSFELDVTKRKDEWCEIAGWFFARFMDMIVCHKPGDFLKHLERDSKAKPADLKIFAKEARKVLTSQEENQTFHSDSSQDGQLTKDVVEQLRLRNVADHTKNLEHSRALNEARGELEADSPLGVGDYVVLHGLEKEWTLNGKTGFVTGAQPERGRLFVCVELDWNRRSDTRTIAARVANLKIAETAKMPIGLLMATILDCCKADPSKVGETKPRIERISKLTKEEIDDEDFDHSVWKREVGAPFAPRLIRSAVRAQYKAPNRAVETAESDRAESELTRAFAKPKVRAKTGNERRVGKAASGNNYVPGGAADLLTSSPTESPSRSTKLNTRQAKNRISC